MSTTLRVDGKDAIIQATELPVVSTGTLFVLKNYNVDTKGLDFPLKAKVEELVSKEKALNDVKNKSSFSPIARMILAVAIIAFAALSIAGVLPFSLPIVIGVVAGCAIASVGLSAYSASQSKTSMNMDIFSPLLYLLGAPFLPICELREAGRLENKVNALKQDIQNHYLEYRSFFQKDHEDLQEKIRDQSQEFRETLDTTRDLPLVSDAEKKRLQASTDQLELAAQEIDLGEKAFPKSLWED
jgi:hypothetical protein